MSERTGLVLNPAYLAVTEAISLYRFQQHNEILTVLSQPPIEWESLVPVPAVPLHDAQRHVDTVREACGVSEDGKETGGAVEEVKESARRVLNELTEMERTTGQASLVVEIDGYPYKLVLPELDSLTQEQHLALARLTRATRIIHRLTEYAKHVEVYISSAPPAPTPTTVLPPPQPPTTTYPALRLAARLVPRFVSVAIKVEIALWMLTRGMRSSDWRYWVCMGAGVGWWMWECAGILKAERRREAQRRTAAMGQNGQGNAGAPNVVVRGPGPGGLPDPGRRTSAASRRHRGPNPLPLLGLGYERRCLRLFYHDPGSTRPITSVADHRIPSSDRNLPLAPDEPGWVWTYLVIPVYLLFLSLWPDGDNARRAAIREREVHMRLLSLKLTEATQTQTQTDESVDHGSDAPPTTPTDTARPPPVIPKNLGPSAKRYWARVLARGETIDWEEERAAQAELLGRAGRDGGAAAAAAAEEEEPMGIF